MLLHGVRGALVLCFFFLVFMLFDAPQQDVVRHVVVESCSTWCCEALSFLEGTVMLGGRCERRRDRRGYDEVCTDKNEEADG